MDGCDLFKVDYFLRFQEEFEDTKGVIRIRKSKKDRQHNGQDTKGVIRSRKPKKDRKHNGHKIPKG